MMLDWDNESLINLSDVEKSVEKILSIPAIFYHDKKSSYYYCWGMQRNT